MLKKMSEKLRAKFPATTPTCSMVKIGPLDESLLKVFEPQASPVIHVGQSPQQKEKKRRKKKEKKIQKLKSLKK